MRKHPRNQPKAQSKKCTLQPSNLKVETPLSNKKMRHKTDNFITIWRKIGCDRKDSKKIHTELTLLKAYTKHTPKRKVQQRTKCNQKKKLLRQTASKGKGKKEAPSKEQ